MKLSLFEINEMNKTIQLLSSQKLPLKGAFKLNQISNIINENIKFYSDKFTEIVQQYSKKDENGKPMLDDSKMNILIQEDKIDECKDAIEQLNKLEVELDDKFTITLNDLGDIECSVQDLQGLTPIVREE